MIFQRQGVAKVTERHGLVN